MQPQARTKAAAAGQLAHLGPVQQDLDAGQQQHWAQSTRQVQVSWQLGNGPPNTRHGTQPTNSNPKDSSAGKLAPNGNNMAQAGFGPGLKWGSWAWGPGRLGRDTVAQHLPPKCITSGSEDRRTLKQVLFMTYKL